MLAGTNFDIPSVKKGGRLGQGFRDQKGAFGSAMPLTMLKPEVHRTFGAMLDEERTYTTEP
jgi:hypothetical protein